MVLEKNVANLEKVEEKEDKNKLINKILKLESKCVTEKIINVKSGFFKKLIKLMVPTKTYQEMSKNTKYK